MDFEKKKPTDFENRKDYLPKKVIPIFLLVSVGRLCDLQGLFLEINNLHTVDCIELQLISM